MVNVTFHFSKAVAVEIKSLNGVFMPQGKNEFPIFDDKNSYNLRITTAEIAIDSSNLANLFNSYVFSGPQSPLTELSVSVEKGRFKVKGKLHDKRESHSRRRGLSFLLPTVNCACTAKKSKRCMFR